MLLVTRLGCIAIALAGAAGLSCAGPDESPVWSLTKTVYDPYGNVALLGPANDSRVNLLLLLAAGQGKPGPADLGQRTFFAWNDLAEKIAPPAEDDLPGEPTVCQSLEGGSRDFAAALAASKASHDEKLALADARKAVAAACEEVDPVEPVWETPASPVARGFFRYVQGAAWFYRGDFKAAAPAFAEVATAPDPWLREAGSYMVARTALNAATVAAIDEYGWVVEPEKRDRKLGTAAESALQAYLKEWPRGRYVTSAQGLLRRAHWIAGDEAALAGDYARLLAAGPAAGTPAALRLAQEIDYKLPDGRAMAAEAGPELLAVADLQRMRQTGELYANCCKPLSAAELAAQAPAFRGREDLYGFVRASHAFHVAKDPKAVLGLIRDDARRGSPDALAFSRQMLRGLALSATGDRNARGFWLELIGGVTDPMQRRAVELALARHDEASGRLDLVFAADSPVRDPLARAILLQHTAGPDLLRRQAKSASDPHERALATWMLLAKQFTRGFYADFLRDLTLVPARAKGTGVPASASAFSDPASYLAAGEIPLGTFANPERDGYACPSLRQTATALESNPLQSAARLCLGEFLRLNGFDWFEFDQPLDEGLGSSRSLFPGTPVVRQDIYRTIIADPKAPADDRAYALFRAVQCYAPSGNNACGGREVAQSQRKAWFQQLKRQYPQSRWARELRYYW